MALMAEQIRPLEFEVNNLLIGSSRCGLRAPSVVSVREINRPEGYRVPEYRNFHVVVEGDGIQAEGWGSGTLLEGIEKAKSEVFERYVFFATNPLTDQRKSSSGWAAHLDFASARNAAVAELIERDSALSAWLNNGPYLAVPRSLWPQSVSSWAQLNSATTVEFGQPTVLLSLGANGCAASVILGNKNGGGVTGHASGFDLNGAIVSAFFEALRSAHAALRFEDFAEVVALHSKDHAVSFGPGGNAMAYAYGEPLPSLNVQYASAEQIKECWRSHVSKLFAHVARARIDYFEISNRVVVHAELDNVSQIFWGPTPASWKSKNNHPHIVG
ncbi:hypothetical protein BH10BDE1_BH10BDE1_28140 [soil metagenome]